jgi:DNA repair protein RecO (recombination protein O)
VYGLRPAPAGWAPGRLARSYTGAVSAHTTTAIVLRTVNYGEADRVVTLFGRTTGRLSALARGARKSQRRFAGGLGLCSVGEISVRERTGADLLTLESFDLTSSHPTFGTDVARMAHAAYVAELVSKLCAPRQVEPGVYDWLATFLDLLDGAGASAERLRVFELGLLGRLGFGPMVASCAVCGGKRSGAGQVDYRWDPDRGGTVCSACGRTGRPIREEVRMTLVRLARTPLPEATAQPLPPDINRGCREALLEIVKHHISGPLHSLEFIAKLGGHP